MALGGGTFVTQNKVLPGTYHNFISASRAFVQLAERGYVGLPIVLNWGPDDEVFTVTAEDFQDNSLRIFGYDYTAPELKGIRDVFKNAHTVYFYKLATNATKASNTYATARYAGVRGNDLRIVIQTNVDDESKFDVLTYLDNILVDEQTVGSASELIDNDFVVFDKTATLQPTAGVPLTGGSNGDPITGLAHQKALDALEAYGFNTLGCLSDDPLIKSLYVEYTKRMRDQVGDKFQLVGYKLGPTDHEGIIDVQNKAIGEGEEPFGMVYWVVGAQAGVPINQSNTNKVYDGEHTPDMSETQTQSQLTELLKQGKYVFHRVGEDIRVLEDINTFISFTPEKSEDFRYNQVIRVLDQIAIDTANLFNTRYLGKVPNDVAGRTAFWNDIVTHRREMQRIRAIQNFDPEQVKVEQGQTKKSIVVTELVEPTVAMSQLYITTIVA